jgi:hypothetical protein
MTVPTQDLNAVGTAIMQTMIVAATETARGIVPIEEVINTPTPMETFTPTLSPTVTLTPSPIFTNTPLVPQISVSVATNCRVGPGKIYDRVGALMVGQVAEVVGRDYAGNYWYIRNPSNPNGFCWLWGEYATVTGNYGVLPMFTPPPTPTPVPAFEASYSGLETCVGWWVNIKVSNTGGVAFKSVSLTVRDTDTDVVVTTTSDMFTVMEGCLDTSQKDTLNSGTSRIISSPAFAYDPSDHTLRATVTVCSAEGLNGTCLTDTIKFKP